MKTPRVLVVGEQAGEPPAGLPESNTGASYVMAADMQAVRSHLAACDVVFHYGEPRDALRANWDLTGNLRWLHVGGVGVDWTLFDELVASDVVMTNSRGIFDTTLPEYLLALMLALAKDLPGTMRAQAASEWRHRLLQPLSGGRVVIVGAGSIARSAGRLLRAMGMPVTLVGRTERDGEPGEGRIRAVADLRQLLPETDWLVVLVPLTPQTHGLIGPAELELLPLDARVVNIARGPVVVERALIDALDAGALAGAALDVFEREPLRPDSPLWDMPNVIVSPHIGGDVADTPTAFSDAFVANLERYIASQPLHNVLDKRLGFVPTE